jgi:hypothetical protein
VSAGRAQPPAKDVEIREGRQLEPLRKVFQQLDKEEVKKLKAAAEKAAARRRKKQGAGQVVAEEVAVDHSGLNDPERLRGFHYDERRLQEQPSSSPAGVTSTRPAAADGSGDRGGDRDGGGGVAGAGARPEGAAPMRRSRSRRGAYGSDQPGRTKWLDAMRCEAERRRARARFTLTVSEPWGASGQRLPAVLLDHAPGARTAGLIFGETGGGSRLVAALTAGSAVSADARLAGGGCVLCGINGHRLSGGGGGGTRGSSGGADASKDAGGWLAQLQAAVQHPPFTLEFESAGGGGAGSGGGAAGAASLAASDGHRGSRVDARTSIAWNESQPPQQVAATASATVAVASEPAAAATPHEQARQAMERRAEAQMSRDTSAAAAAAAAATTSGGAAQAMTTLPSTPPSDGAAADWRYRSALEQLSGGSYGLAIELFEAVLVRTIAAVCLRRRARHLPALGLPRRLNHLRVSGFRPTRPTVRWRGRGSSRLARGSPSPTWCGGRCVLFGGRFD